MSSDADFIHWITHSAAGMRQPGLFGDLRSDLAAVHRAHIGLLVSLTVEAVPESALATYGIKGRHFPIIGMGIPTVAAALGLCEELAQALSLGSKIGLHCTAGIGRTGMMLACHLTWRGKTAADAIVRVRQRIPRAIQTKAQEAFVYRFAEAAATRNVRRP